MTTTDEMTLTIHLGRPFRNWWSATIDGYDGTRNDDPKHDDNRTGTAPNKWDAIRNLIDALEEHERRDRPEPTDLFKAMGLPELPPFPSIRTEETK